MKTIFFVVKIYCLIKVWQLWHCGIWDGFEFAAFNIALPFACRFGLLDPLDLGAATGAGGGGVGLTGAGALILTLH